MSKEFIKTLALIELVLGIIGSFFLSYSRGIIEPTSRFRDYERSWGITIGTFLTSILSVLVLYAILYALYKIIDNQESILYKLSDRNLTISSNENQNKDIKEDQWRCSDCGKINYNYVGICGCGRSKTK